MSKITLLLTNDWELYGEGSGDFYEIQQARLHGLLSCAESYGAKVTLFAEVGQQFSHLAQSQVNLRAIARDWEDCVRETVTRGHDVQLHWHPTWKNAVHDGKSWNLDLNTWALADVDPEESRQLLVRGRDYLNSLCQPCRKDYECLAFRSGAFCLQPYRKTIPVLEHSGLSCDCSVVPGAWDYLYFDYRSETRVHPYRLSDLLLEIPIFTERYWDSPILRRSLAAVGLRSAAARLHFGASADPTYEAWAEARDQKLSELSPVLDPLAERRQKSRLSVKQLPSFFFRKSTRVLDYDFMAPGVFADLVERASLRAKGKDITIAALGHANNSHNFENLDRTLETLKIRFGDRLSYSTVQAATEVHSSREKNPSRPAAPRLAEP